MNETTQQLPSFNPEDINLVPQILDGLQIMRLVMLSSSFNRDAILDEHPTIEMQIGTTNQITAYVDAPTKQAWARINLSLFASPIDPQFKDKTPFKIESLIEARYTTTKEVPDEVFNRAMTAFCLTASLPHAWSFFRQHTVDAMSKMNLPVVLLPLLIQPNPIYHAVQNTQPIKNKPIKKTK